MFHSPQVPRQAEAAQLGTHTQHCPLPTLHGPADDVTVQGADTLVSKTASLQSHVSPHTATVLVTAHTQHSPLPTSQLPVDDRTEHIALSLLTSAAVPQSQVSPQTAIVRVCVTWRRVAGGSGPSSPPRTPCAQVGMASPRIRINHACVLQIIGRLPPSPGRRHGRSIALGEGVHHWTKVYTPRTLVQWWVACREEERRAACCRYGSIGQVQRYKSTGRPECI